MIKKKTMVTEEEKVAIPTDENEDIIDNQAKKLDINDCEFSISDADIKNIEYTFFEQFEIHAMELFGGTMHHSKGIQPGGCSEFCVSQNGKLLAIAIDNGSILVYDTVEFSLIRIYQGSA